MNTHEIGKPLKVALTLCARDYKGLGGGNSLGNGVVEKIDFNRDA